MHIYERCVHASMIFFACVCVCVCVCVRVWLCAPRLCVCVCVGRKFFFYLRPAGPNNPGVSSHLLMEQTFPILKIRSPSPPPPRSWPGTNCVQGGSYKCERRCIYFLQESLCTSKARISPPVRQLEVSKYQFIASHVQLNILHFV